MMSIYSKLKIALLKDFRFNLLLILLFGDNRCRFLTLCPFLSFATVKHNPSAVTTASLEHRKLRSMLPRHRQYPKCHALCCNFASSLSGRGNNAIPEMCHLPAQHTLFLLLRINENSECSDDDVSFFLLKGAPQFSRPHGPADFSRPVCKGTNWLYDRTGQTLLQLWWPGGDLVIMHNQEWPRSGLRLNYAFLIEPR